MDLPIERTDNSDEEVICLPVSADDAAALAVILKDFISQNKGIVIPQDLPDRNEVQETNDYLVEKAEELFIEAMELCRYFLPDEDPKKKIIIPKPDW